MSDSELMVMWGEYLDTCREIARENRRDRSRAFRFESARGDERSRRSGTDEPDSFPPGRFTGPHRA